jgi:alpha-glucosidase
MPFIRLLISLLAVSPLGALARLGGSPGASAAAKAPALIEIISPDGAVRVAISLTSDGAPTYTVHFREKEVVRASRLGLMLAEADLTKGLRLNKASPVTTVDDRYTLNSDKRSHCRYTANRRVLHFSGPAGPRLSVVFQVSNDGVAFRYELEGKGAAVYHLTAEQTSFQLPVTAKGWLHPHAKAGTGWSRTQPSYEEHYAMAIPVGTPSPLGEGWSFPALFEVEGQWLLLTEAGMGRTYCGTHLAHAAPGSAYTIALAQAPERTAPQAALLPESPLPWVTPWRVLVLGATLAPIVESTLTTDLSAPAQTPVLPDAPGLAAWSWVMLGDNSMEYATQQKFVDFAAAMDWRYCLVDAYWDTRLGYAKTAELASYARAKNVALLLWYNSNGNWNDAPQSPIQLLVDPAGRRREFARLQQMGIAGVKIDFFGGDGQSFMNYYQDLLEDAARYGLLVNFHGTTIPRGWNRTYPNLLTMEAVRGFEFVTFDSLSTERQPTHCAMLPFTRNAVGPMDFTPVCLGELAGKQRRTSNAFELALAVLFQSGIQHYALTPDDLATQPPVVVETLRRLPRQWDEVKLLDGYPGQYAVLARRAADKWYVAGINGSDAPRPIQLDLRALGFTTGTLIADGTTHRTFATRPLTTPALTLTLPAHGGFLIRPD